MPLQIFYGTYAFHQTGVPSYGLQIQPESGQLPVRQNHTYRVRHKFLEESFADNEARLRELKIALETQPRAVLRILDERGTVLLSQEVRFGGLEVPEDWGQFQREVSLSFETYGKGVTAGPSATFAPTGGIAIVLPNIQRWEGSVRAERYSEQAPNRKSVTETVAGSGKVIADPALAAEERRDYLLAQKALIEGMIDWKDGVLTFGEFEETMKIEEARADLGDAQEELTWSFTATRWRFPEGVYAEADYEIVHTQSRTGDPSMAVSGRVLADTLAHAEEEALAIKSRFSAGRTLETQEIRHREVSGGDGTAALELNFSFRFLEAATVTSFDLRISTKTDHRSGDVTTSYSGKVRAATSAAAIAKARALGANKMPFLLSATEDVSSEGSGETETFGTVDFSYEYLGKSAVRFAEVRVERSAERFGTGAVSVSGYVTALTEATAMAYADGFKIAGMIIRSEKVTPATLSRDDAPAHFSRLEFGYAYETAITGASISYGKDTETDWKARQRTITFQGSAFAATLLAANAMINAVAVVSGVRVRSKRTENYDAQGSLSVLREVSFSEQFSTVIGVNEGSDVIEAGYSIEINWPVWKAQIDLIPYAKPYVQERVHQSIGSITVSGSITTANSVTGETWMKAKKALATGYLDVCQERHEFVMNPLSSSSVAMNRWSFTYASNDLSLAARN